jgi:hypothetical protein
VYAKKQLRSVAIFFPPSLELISAPKLTLRRPDILYSPLCPFPFYPCRRETSKPLPDHNACLFSILPMLSRNLLELHRRLRFHSTYVVAKLDAVTIKTFPPSSWHRETRFGFQNRVCLSILLLSILLTSSRNLCRLHLTFSILPISILPKSSRNEEAIAPSRS